MSSQPTNVILDAAFSYAALGWHVFPLVARTKSPFAGSHGHLDATTDPKIIAAWWRANPDANIGVFLKASALLVIDVNPRHGGDVTFARDLAILGPLPPTLTVLSGGHDRGKQFYFRAPFTDVPDPGKHIPGKLGEGVDIKWNGLVVVPPSIHPSGRAYAWKEGLGFGEIETAELPVAWKNIFDARARASSYAAQIRRVAGARSTAASPASAAKARRALELEYQIVASASGGERNNRLHHAACTLSRFVDDGHLTEDEIAIHLGAAARVCGLPSREAQRTIESGLSQRARSGR